MSSQTIKTLFPFRLGCTSYVYPDDILPNVEKMAPLIDDVEIILFESEDSANLPDAQTVAGLQAIAEETSITYTIHFPIDRMAGSNDRKERAFEFKQIHAIVSRMHQLT